MIGQVIYNHADSNYQYGGNYCPNPVVTVVLRQAWFEKHRNTIRREEQSAAELGPLCVPM